MGDEIIRTIHRSDGIINAAAILSPMNITKEKKETAAHEMNIIGYGAKLGVLRLQ